VTAVMKEYHNRIIALSRAALAKAGEQDLLRAQCHDLIGDSSFQNRDFEEALKNYQVILEKFPDFPEMGNTIMAAGQTYLELRRYDDGIAFIRKTIVDRQQDPNLPNYHEVLWKLLEAAGNLDAMEQQAREVQKVFPLRLLSLDQRRQTGRGPLNLEDLLQLAILGLHRFLHQAVLSDLLLQPVRQTPKHSAYLCLQCAGVLCDLLRGQRVGHRDRLLRLLLRCPFLRIKLRPATLFQLLRQLAVRHDQFFLRVPRRDFFGCFRFRHR
jgi:tetratricopeptide (TPR) repeat protein